jgi:hypothetical protein
MGSEVIMLRSAWADAPDLGDAAKESARVSDNEMPDDVRWVRSYVLTEPDVKLGE